MKKILITSLRFTNDGTDLLGKKDGSPAIIVELNNGHAITIQTFGAFISYETDAPGGRLTRTEFGLSRIVYDASRGYLHGWEPETMDGFALSAAGKLVDRIDWSAAGYGEGATEDKYMTLCDCIANYQNF